MTQNFEHYYKKRLQMATRDVVMALFIVLLLNGCGGDTEPSITPHHLSQNATISSRELAQDSLLHAQTHQTLILTTKGASASTAELTQSNSTHRIPYYLDKDELITFSLGTENSCIAEIEIDDTAGNNLMSINLDAPTTQLFLTSGQYVLTLVEVSPLPDHCSQVFVHTPQAPTSSTLAAPADTTDTTTDSVLFNDNVWRLFGGIDAETGTSYFHDVDHFGINRFNGTISGSWTDYDSTPYKTFGLIRRGVTDRGDPLVDSALVSENGVSGKLFNLTPGNSRRTYYDWMLKVANIRDDKPDEYSSLPFGCYLDNTQPDPTNLQYLQDSDPTRPGAIFAFVQPVWRVQMPTGCYSLAGQTDYYRFKLTQGKTLHDFNFTISGQGSTANFTIDTANPSASRNHDALGIVTAKNTENNGDATLPLHEILRQHFDDVSSLSPDCDEVIIYSDPEYKGTALVLNAGTSYKNFPIEFDFAVGSIKVVSNATCSDTTTLQFNTPTSDDTDQTTNIGSDSPDPKKDGKFAGKDLSLNNGFSVFRSKDVVISGNCPGCNLENADLTGLVLDNRDFSGANFIDADLHDTSLKNCNLKRADLRGAHLINANLQDANLYMASLNDSPNSASRGAANLSGAYMRGANLANAELTGATLDYVSFHSPFTNNCIPDSSGDITTNPKCSSAYKAKLAGASFEGAYIPGLNLSGAKLSGVDFSNAFAMNTNFSGSEMNTDLLGMSTIFHQTVLLGAVFDNARFQGVDFYNAYLTDPDRPQEVGSAIAVVYLSETFTGEGVCTEYTITQNENMRPPTDHTTTCPNGSLGPCTQAQQWTPQVPFRSLSEQIVLNYKSPAVGPQACQGIINYFW